MTREEAIEILKDCELNPCVPQDKEAVNLAIKALEKEPCEDAISRSQVLKELEESAKHHANDSREEVLLRRDRDIIRALPPVKPVACIAKVNFSKEDMQEIVDKKVAEITVEPRWIPVSERLPETDNKNSMNSYNVLLWVKDKNDPKDEPQVYLGKLRHIDGDDGSGNFWGVKTKPCDWTIWGWSYFCEPEVVAWMPLPEPYKAESEE